MNAIGILPPTARDFDIHRMNLVEHVSTYRIAEKHGISQTRVRQVIQRVCDWLAEALPVKTEAQQEQETRLARHLAADQLRHQIEQLQIFWDATSDPKYLRQQTRVITALGRLGIVPGTIDSLAADAIEGPLPQCGADDLVTRVPPGNALPRGSSLAESPTSVCPTSPPPGDCSPADSPAEKSQAIETSAPENQSAASPSTTEPSDQHSFTAESELPGLNLMEKRLLTLLDDTLASDQERRESLEQTLANVRRQKAALEIRISPQVPGATLRDNPATHHSPTDHSSLPVAATEQQNHERHQEHKEAEPA